MNWNPEVYVPVLLFLLHPPGSLFFSVGVWFTPVCNLHLCHTWLHRVCALQVLLDVVGEPVSGLQRLCPTAAQGRFAGSASLRQLCCPGVWGAPVLPGSTELMLRWAQEALKVWCALVCVAHQSGSFGLLITWRYLNIWVTICRWPFKGAFPVFSSVILTPKTPN